MGNFCSAPMPSRRFSDDMISPQQLDLIGQLSYDIYRIQEDSDHEGKETQSDGSLYKRSKSKVYYEVRKSPLSRTQSQLRSASSLSHRSTSSRGMAIASSWIRRKQHAWIDLTGKALGQVQQQLQEASSSSSSPESVISSVRTPDSSESSPPAELPHDKSHVVNESG